MIRSLVGMVVLVGAVCWMPVWFQLVLFVLAVVFLAYKVLFLVPAVIADILYAPTASFSLANLKMTLIVSALIVSWFIIMHQTRISHVVPTK